MWSLFLPPEEIEEETGEAESEDSEGVVAPSLSRTPSANGLGVSYQSSTLWGLKYLIWPVVSIIKQGLTHRGRVTFWTLKPFGTKFSKI